MPVLTPDTASWLVATKLHPPTRRSDTIRRPHLEEELARSVSSLPVTLLSAPAGYGKTTMLAALPHLLPGMPLAWVTLDNEDNDPIRFVGLLAAALQSLHPDCGRSVWSWLAGGGAEGTSLKRAMGALINDILTCLPEPLVLVLDDLHFVAEPAVYVTLEYLLDHQPPQLHIAVGTRHDPPLRLARLAARRQLAELRRPDLGFSPDEAHQLLNDSLGLSLTQDEMAALQERTEGWPAGLCLLAGPLARLGSTADRTQFMAAIGHSERYALDFLAEEVLRDLPADVRRFLLQTAILAEMSPSLCRAVTGREDAGEVLEVLYRQNLTIASIATVDGEPVYRHHALFARLLTRQLERELSHEIVELHRRAAQAQQTAGRAVFHYLAAGLWEQAAEQMAQSGMELLHRGMSETIRHWHRALPEETRANHPRLMVLIARCEIQTGNYDAAGVLLEQAREACVAVGDILGEGEALSSLITVAVQRDDRRAAAALVKRDLELPLGPPGRVAALLARSWLHMADGHWVESCADMHEALAIPRAAGNRMAAFLGVTYMNAMMTAVPGCLDLTERFTREAYDLAIPQTALQMGAEELGTWPLLLRGQTAEAQARAEAAETLRHRVGGWPVLGSDTALLLAVLHTARGDLDAAGQAVESLLERAQRAPVSRRMLYFHGAGRTLALLGRRDEAEAACQRLRGLPDDQPITRYLQDHLTGLLALLAGRQGEAAGVLERAARLEGSLPISRVGGSALLLQARLLLDQGRRDAALTAVTQVLRAWELASTPGCALLDGPAGVPAFRLAAQHGSGIAARLLQYFPQQAPRPVVPHAAMAALPEPLSQRECDVLKLIVAGKTNRQIGEELYITEETVKSHVVRILRKLDVTSRTQAAIRGRELGL